MTKVTAEERSWEGPEGEAAVSELKQAVERLRGHVRVYRRVAECEPREAPPEDAQPTTPAQGS